MITRRLRVPILVCLLTCSTLIFQLPTFADGKISTRIVNGKPVSTTSTEYPWMTALLVADVENGFQAQFCGGALIAPDLILTAAHCVDTDTGPVDPAEIEVAVGVVDLDGISQEQRQPVEEIMIHPDWDSDNIVNDLALLRVDGDTNQNIALLPIVSSATRIVKGTSVRAIGWGALDSAGDIYPSILQTGELKIASTPGSGCLGWGDWFYPESMICAMGGSASKIVDTCFGDSGSPLLIRQGRSFATLGVVSWGGNECAVSQDYPGVYTRLTSFRDWIGGYTESISSFSPQSGSPGTLITLTGYFGGGVESVFVGDYEAEVISSAETSLVVAIPVGPTKGKISVNLSSGRTSYSQVDVTVRYATTRVSLTNLSGSVGSTVQITGSNLQNILRIQFPGASSDAEFDLIGGTIFATVPPGSVSGKIAFITPARRILSPKAFIVT